MWKSLLTFGSILHQQICIDGRRIAHESHHMYLLMVELNLVYLIIRVRNNSFLTLLWVKFLYVCTRSAYSEYWVLGLDRFVFHEFIFSIGYYFILFDFVRFSSFEFWILYLLWALFSDWTKLEEHCAARQPTKWRI